MADQDQSTLGSEAVDAAGLLFGETWSLSVTADPFVEPPHVELPATIDTPLRLDLASLQALGHEQCTVKSLKASSGKGLPEGVWEGVSLASVLRECGKTENVRRVNYWGFHDDAPAQIFSASVSFTEAMEPPAGEPPVMLCWALNGKPLHLEQGGPIRMVVPRARGYKSTKWVKHITLTNDDRVVDTYDVGNDPVKRLQIFSNDGVPELPDWAEDIRDWIDTNGALLLDVRTVQEVATHPVKGAHHISIQTLEENIPTLLETVGDKNRAIGAFCAAGIRSQKAVQILERHEFTRVKNVHSADLLKHLEAISSQKQ